GHRGRGGTGVPAWSLLRGALRARGGVAPSRSDTEPDPVRAGLAPAVCAGPPCPTRSPGGRALLGRVRDDFLPCGTARTAPGARGTADDRALAADHRRRARLARG